MNDKPRAELASYLHTYKANDKTQPLFYPDKRSGFTVIFLISDLYYSRSQLAFYVRLDLATVQHG